MEGLALLTITYFQDFKRDDSSDVTVEYEISYGSSTTYSPAYGADGGEGVEVTIVKVFDDINPSIQYTDDENERWSDYIAEHHEFDYCEEY